MGKDVGDDGEKDTAGRRNDLKEILQGPVNTCIDLRAWNTGERIRMALRRRSCLPSQRMTDRLAIAAELTGSEVVYQLAEHSWQEEALCRNKVGKKLREELYVILWSSKPVAVKDYMHEIGTILVQ